MIDSFRDRLLSELTELIPAVDDQPRTAMPIAPPRGRGRRILVAAATAAVVVGAALVLTVLDGPVDSTPAWAIERSPEGDVLVTVHEVDDVARLQEDLRAAGIPAVVRAGSDSCAVWSVRSQPEMVKVLREDVRRAGDEHFWRIDPSALKPGHVLAFLITPPSNDGDSVARSNAYQIIVVATDDPSCAPHQGMPSAPR